MEEPSHFSHDVESLLEMLRMCAKQLLLAYDENQHDEIWLAFEKTAEACEFLTFGTEPQKRLTIH